MANKKENIFKQKFQAMSALLSRYRIMTGLGTDTYAGERDIYKVCGYPKTLVFQDYYNRFVRGDIAKRVIKSPVNGSWETQPNITGPDNFIKAFEEVEQRVELFANWKKIDTISGIGEYGVLLLGLSDVTRKEDLELPVEGSNLQLLFVSPFMQDSAEVKDYVTDMNDMRYGKPLTYQITEQIGDQTSNLIVHQSRIIHIAEDTISNKLLGTPRLEAVYNRIIDIEKILAGSGEMFWKGARPGYAAQMDKDAQISTPDIDAIKDEIEEFEHGLTRFLKVKGMDIKDLAPQVANPMDHFKVQVQAIACATGIPVRILLGSERGELSSNQDETAWNKILENRRLNYVNPYIIEKTLNALVSYGVLPEAEFKIEWADLWTPSAKEKAETNKLRSEALAIYTNAMGASSIIPPEIFLKKLMDFTDDEIKEMITFMSKMVLEEDIPEEMPEGIAEEI